MNYLQKLKIENPEKYQKFLEKNRKYGATSRARRTPEQVEKIRQYNLKWKSDHKEHNKIMMKKWRVDVKKRVFEHYGNKCACCGEFHREFLVIDHINGGGNKHRKALGRLGTAFFKWLENQGFPEGYRVLCHNCNQSLGCYGYCPHEEDCKTPLPPERRLK